MSFGGHPTIRNYQLPITEPFDLPQRFHRGRIHDATIRGATWSLDDQQYWPITLAIHPQGDLYVFDVALTPVLPMPNDRKSYIAVAARRGVIEHVEFPTWLLDLSRAKLQPTFAGRKDRLVPRRGYDELHLPDSSPFQPYGRWERAYSTPQDLTLRARMCLPQSIAPFPFSKALDRLVHPYMFPRVDSLTLAHEALPRSSKRSAR